VKNIWRAIDANFNRIREGLRVSEEVTRFVWDDKALTKRLKSARQRIQGIYKEIPNISKIIATSRNSQDDIGKKSSFAEMRRGSANEIFYANIQRSKESARVLEEFLKLIDARLSDRCKSLRFYLYEIEKRALAKRRI